MATIVPSQEAPSEAVTYSLANETFELDAGGSFETDNRAVISNANAHPWLEVEEDPALVTDAEDESDYDPSKDALSAENSIAFDPVEVAKAREEAASSQPVAIEAGLDQDEPVEVGDTAVTLAADDFEGDDE